MGRGVVLVRHARPEVTRGLARSLWPLSEHSLEDCMLLAHQLPADLAPRIFSSPERKAEQTARVIALRRSLRIEIDPRLREVDRPETWDDAYRESAAQYLAAGGAPGWEPPAQVARRFGDCVDAALAAEPKGDLVVVDGGLALTLFAASRWAIDDVERFWRSLAMPDAYRFDIETGTGVRLVFGGQADDPKPGAPVTP